MTARLLSDLRKAAGLGPAVWHDVARAVGELALANRRLGSRSTNELLGLAGTDRASEASQKLSPIQRRLLARVAFAIPRIGARVPWRADCLVQALAARRWLARHGVTSNLCIGVQLEAGFAAHAWLKVGEEIVTGGDIDGYVPILSAIDAESTSTATSARRAAF